MINILEDLENPQKHIPLMMDSVSYIEDRLSTYYGTDKEKDDIQRNLEYLQVMLSKSFIVSNLTQEQLLSINTAIDRASSILIIS